MQGKALRVYASGSAKRKNAKQKKKDETRELSKIPRITSFIESRIEAPNKSVIEPQNPGIEQIVEKNCYKSVTIQDSNSNQISHISNVSDIVNQHFDLEHRTETGK